MMVGVPHLICIPSEMRTRKGKQFQCKGFQINSSDKFTWYSWRGKKNEFLVKKCRQRSAMLRFLKELKHCASLDGWAEFLKHGKAETEASSFNKQQIRRICDCPNPWTSNLFPYKNRQTKQDNKQTKSSSVFRLNTA